MSASGFVYNIKKLCLPDAQLELSVSEQCNRNKCLTGGICCCGVAQYESIHTCVESLFDPNKLHDDTELQQTTWTVYLLSLPSSTRNHYTSTYSLCICLIPLKMWLVTVCWWCSFVRSFVCLCLSARLQHNGIDHATQFWTKLHQKKSQTLG